MKIVITEEQDDKLKENLLKLKKNLLTLIKQFGVLGTINRVGYEKFNSIYPDYFKINFKNNRDKIELLNEIISNGEEEDNGEIRLDTIGADILIRTEILDEGHILEHYIDYITKDKCGVTIWEYDEEGSMYDEYYDTYDIWLEDLKTPIFNQIFDMVLKTF
jgi:hypothetical protein